MTTGRLFWRGTLTIAHLATGAAASVVLQLVGAVSGPPACRPRIVRWWHRRLCRILGLRIQVQGRLPDTPVLLAANHISWLDIHVLGSLYPMAFIAKSEVRAWPLVGWLSAVAGTLFIHRGGGQGGRMADIISARLRGGSTLVLFPEGTTTDGGRVGRFHPRLFAATQETVTPVVPTAIRYGDGPAPDPTAPFVGDDDLVSHLLRVLRRREIPVGIAFTAPLAARDGDRRWLADRSRAAVTRALVGMGVAVSETEPGTPGDGKRKGVEKSSRGSDAAGPSPEAEGAAPVYQIRRG